MNKCTKTIQNQSYEIKSDNYWYRRVGSPIPIWGAIKKVGSAPNMMSHFGCTNIIFVDWFV